MRRRAGAGSLVVLALGCLEAPPRLQGQDSRAQSGTAEVSSDAPESPVIPNDAPATLEGLIAQWRFDDAVTPPSVAAALGSCGPSCDAATVGLYGAPWRGALKGSGQWQATGTHSGRYLQLDGDDDALRVASAASLFAGKTALTVEVRLRLSPIQEESGGARPGGTLLVAADWADDNKRSVYLGLDEGRAQLVLWPPNPKEVCSQRPARSPGAEPRCTTELASPDALPLDRWTVLSFTWVAGGATRLLVDGVVVAEGTSLVSQLSPGNLPLWIGGAELGAGTATVDFLAADLDYVRVYDRALTVAEVLANVTASAPLVTSGGDRPAPCAPSDGGCADGKARDLADWPGISACEAPDAAAAWDAGLLGAVCANGYHLCAAGEFRRLTPNRLLWELRGNYWICPGNCTSWTPFADLDCTTTACPGASTTPIEVTDQPASPSDGGLVLGCGSRWCRALRTDSPMGTLCCADSCR